MSATTTTVRAPAPRAWPSAPAAPGAMATTPGRPTSSSRPRRCWRPPPGCSCAATTRPAAARARAGLRYLDAETGPARGLHAGRTGRRQRRRLHGAVRRAAVAAQPAHRLRLGRDRQPHAAPGFTRLDALAPAAGPRRRAVGAQHAEHLRQPPPQSRLQPDAGRVASTARSGLTPLLQDTEPQRLFPAGVQATVHGHIHMHQALGFSSNHPITLVIGNGGSAASGHVDAAAALTAELVRARGWRRCRPIPSSACRC